MYMMAGHFSYVEFAISERTFPFVPQLANMARLAIIRAKESILDPVDEDSQMGVSHTHDAHDNGEAFHFNEVSFGITIMRPRLGY